MNLASLLPQIDAQSARAFVSAARHIIDALLIEAERVEATQTPAPRDYTAAALDRTAPAGGWIGVGELRATSRQLNEAIAAEKWTDGLLCALKLMALLGGGL